jgi:hypothetical protein
MLTKRGTSILSDISSRLSLSRLSPLEAPRSFYATIVRSESGSIHCNNIAIAILQYYYCNIAIAILLQLQSYSHLPLDPKHVLRADAIPLRPPHANNFLQPMMIVMIIMMLLVLRLMIMMMFLSPNSEQTTGH